MDLVELQEYQGKWLTEAEIQLSMFFEVKHEDRANELRAKKMEREIMAKRSLTVQQQQQLEQEMRAKKAAPPAEAPVAPTVPTPKEIKKEEVPMTAPEAKKPEFRNPYVPQIPIEELTAMDVDNEEPTHAALQRKEPSKPTKIIKKKAVLDETELEDAADAQGHLDPENLFSHVGILHDSTWKSATANSEPLVVPLRAFSFSQKQTLGLKLTVPNDSVSWSLNVCAGKDWHNNNILLHFNPRYKKKTVITNDKQGTWGLGHSRQIAKESSSKNDGLLAKDIDLMIQLRTDGFYIFANDMFSDFFPHRRDPTGGAHLADLKLIVNNKDANGKVQDIIVHKVWWGRRDPSHNPLPLMAQSKATRAAKEENELISRTIPFHLRSLLIRGLPMGQFDLVECQAIEFALQDVFTEFGVEDVSVIPGQGYAFMRLSNPASVKPSIAELSGATIVLSETAGTDGDGAEEGSTLDITPMAL